MNSFSCVDTYYLRASRTIETILVENGNRQNLFFVYNYEGNHFRLFYSIDSLVNFFSCSDAEVYCDFETDEELDNFLGTVKLRGCLNFSTVAVL